jgi:hypothetical protein
VALDPTFSVKELFSTEAIRPETDCVSFSCDCAELCLAVVAGAGTAKVAAARAKLAKADATILISFFIPEASSKICDWYLGTEHQERQHTAHVRDFRYSL